MKLNLKALDKSDKDLLKKWDDFVEESEEGTFYHKSYWLLNNISNNFKEAQEYNFYYLEDKNKKWKAAFYISFSKKLGRKFVVMPHMTPYGGVMYSKDIHELTPNKKISNMKEIDEVFISELKKYILLYYSFSPEHKDIQNFIWSKYSPSIRYTYRVELKSEDELWKNFADRSMVNKAKKSNVSMKWGKKELIDIYFELNDKSFEKQNINKFDNELTKKLIVNLIENNSAIIGILYDDNEEAIAGCVLAYDTKRAYYIMGGIARANNYSMSYLLWESILFTMNSLKLEVFDFEGSMIPSIERYFRKFGGDIVPYYSLNNILLLIKNKLR